MKTAALLVLLTALRLSAANVVVANGNPPVHIVSAVTGTYLPNLKFRVGYFLNFADTPQFRSILSALPGETKNYMETNFVPLAEPGAFILTLNGMTGAQLGDTIAISQSPVGTSGYLGTSGPVTGGVIPLTFNTQAPNTLSMGGVPRGSRMFLVAYTGESWQTTEEFGIYSSTLWSVPASTVLNTMAMVLTPVDTSEEIFRGWYGGGDAFGPISLAMMPAPIPEPGSVALLAAGLTVALGARVRRQ